MLALVTKTTDCSIAASTVSCSAPDVQTARVPSVQTLARVKVTVSASCSGGGFNPSTRCLTALTSAPRRSSWARSARCMKSPDQAV